MNARVVGCFTAIPATCGDLMGLLRLRLREPLLISRASIGGCVSLPLLPLTIAYARYRTFVVVNPTVATPAPLKGTARLDQNCATFLRLCGSTTYSSRFLSLLSHADHRSRSTFPRSSLWNAPLFRLYLVRLIAGLHSPTSHHLSPIY